MSALQFNTIAVDGELAPECNWLDGGQGFVVCAYYTPNYLPHAIKLRRSLDALRINYFLKRFEPAGNWAAGTRIKPGFIEDCLARFYPRHVLYVDADAVVRQELTLLGSVTTSIAMCFIPTEKHVRLSVGTIYVRNTAEGRQFVSRWRNEGNACDPSATDSEAMHKVFKQSPGLSITVLPLTYIGRDDQAETVVQHFSVSRNKRKQNKRLRRRITILGGLVALCFFGGFLLFALR
jgi:hypothetical protein